MNREQIHDKLTQLHKREDEFNKEVNLIDKQILALQKRKDKVCKFISRNMKYRNNLIKQL